MTQFYANPEQQKIMFSRTISFPHDMEDPEMVEQMFADLVYAGVGDSGDGSSNFNPSPKSPISEENYPVSPNSIVENDVDAILDEVLSMHDSLSSPPSPKSTFSDDQTTNGPESADQYFVPDLPVTLMNSNQENQERDNQPIIISSNQEAQQTQQGTIKTVMTENGEYFNVVVIPSDQLPENYRMGNVIFSPKREDTKMECMSSPLSSSAAPLTPPASVAPVSPEQSPVTEERVSRKRCQNKQSSKRYRQKIKNKEQALFDAVGDLNKKKRELELELASTKAVNKFLVDSLKQKFGIF